MDLATTVAGIGDIILLLTMVVFAYQARQMALESRETAAATRSVVYQGISEQMQEIDRFLIDRPHLRPYIYDGAPEPGTDQPEQRSQVEATAEMFMDLFDNFVTQSGNIPEELYGPWHRYALNLMETSPAMQRFWAENREWYSTLLQDVLSTKNPVQDLLVRREAAREWENINESLEQPAS